jgi:hypothetical protein
LTASFFIYEKEIPENSEVEYNQIMEWVRAKNHDDMWKFIKKTAGNNDFMMWKLKNRVAVSKPVVSKA